MERDYNATAEFFAQKAAKARDPSEKERLTKVAAEYRARAFQNVQDQISPPLSPVR